MVKDFHLPIDVRVGTTSRELDGLAMSSRNVYLGSRRRNIAVVLSQSLKAAERQYQTGKRGRADILWPATEVADKVLLEQDDLAPKERARFEVDYISLADPDSLEELEAVDESRGAILSGAIKMLAVEEPRDEEDLGIASPQGPVRLIDNIIIPPKVM